MILIIIPWAGVVFYNLQSTFTYILSFTPHHKQGFLNASFLPKWEIMLLVLIFHHGESPELLDPTPVLQSPFHAESTLRRIPERCVSCK